MKDCLCFLRWIYNGRDKGAMLRAFQTPSRGIGDKAIDHFNQYCALVEAVYAERPESPPSPLEILLSLCDDESEGMPPRGATIPTRPLRIFTDFAHQMRALVDLAFSAPLEQVLASVISGFGLMADFDKVSDSKEEFRERQSNVNELLHATKRYNQDGPCLRRAAQVDSEVASMGQIIKSPMGAFCKANITWNSGAWLMSRSGCKASTISSKGTS